MDCTFFELKHIVYKNVIKNVAAIEWANGEIMAPLILEWGT